MHSALSCLQCRPNIQTGPKGACPDDVQGGVSNVTALRGRRESNGRCVEYVRPLSATGECSHYMQVVAQLYISVGYYWVSLGYYMVPLGYYWVALEYY